MDLRSYMTVLRTYWSTVTDCLLLRLLAAARVTATTKPVYQAKVQWFIANQNGADGVGVLGFALTSSLTRAFGYAMARFLPIFYVSDETLALQLAAAILIGVVAAALPAWRAAKERIVDGLRAIG